MSNSKKSPKKSVHVTISDDSYNTIEKYEEEYGSKSAVVDEALGIFKKFKEPKREDVKKAWCRARNELNMLLVGKTTFLAYITGQVENAFRKNIAIEVIEWYEGKRIDQMSFEEFLEGLIGMWHVANYFYKIDLDENKEGAYQIRFNHDLNKDYSTYWANYFETLLTDNWDCSVDKFIRNESFYLIIKKE